MPDTLTSPGTHRGHNILRIEKPRCFKLWTDPGSPDVKHICLRDQGHDLMHVGKFYAVDHSCPCGAETHHHA